MSTYSYVRTGTGRYAGKSTEDNPLPLPPPLKPFDLSVGDLVKLYDAETYSGQWRLCEVASIYPYIVACRDLKTGVMLSFRILDYRANDGVMKITLKEVHNE